MELSWLILTPRSEQSDSFHSSRDIGEFGRGLFIKDLSLYFKHEKGEMQCLGNM